MTNLQSTYIESRSLWKSLSARIRGVRRLAFSLHPGVKLSRADSDNSWQQTGIPTDHCCWVTRIVRWLCWIWCLENILGKVSVMKRVPWCVCATSHYLSDWRATFLPWFFKSQCGGSSSYRSSKKLELACEFFAPSPSPAGMNRRFKATDIVCCQRESVHTACVTQSGSASIVGCLFSMIHLEADWVLLRKNTVIIVSQKQVYRTRAQVLHRLNLEQEENLFDSGRSSSFLR